MLLAGDKRMSPSCRSTYVHCGYLKQNSCYTVLATGVNVAHSQRVTWGLGGGSYSTLTCTCHLHHVLLPLALLIVPFFGFSKKLTLALLSLCH